VQIETQSRSLGSSFFHGKKEKRLEMNFPSKLIIVAAILKKFAIAEVAYTVYSGSCQNPKRFKATLMDPQEQKVGFCQNYGIGKSVRNCNGSINNIFH